MNSNSRNKIRIIIKKLTEVLVVVVPIMALIVACFDTLLHVMNTQNQQGGAVYVSYYSHQIMNKESKTVVVYYGDTSIVSNELSVAPTFENPCKYSLKDFSLSFEVECSNVTLVPTSYYHVQQYGNNKYVYNYNEKVLAAYDKTPPLFSEIILDDLEGNCKLKARASFNGALTTYECRYDVCFFAGSNYKNITIEGVKKVAGKPENDSLPNGKVDFFVFVDRTEAVCLFDVPLNEVNQVDYQLNQINSSGKNTCSGESGQGMETIEITSIDDSSEKSIIKESVTILLYFTILIILILSAISGVFHLFMNIILVFIGVFEKSIHSIGDVWDYSSFVLSRKDEKKFSSNVDALEFRVLTILTIISPITCYLCLNLRSTSDFLFNHLPL